mmetsp:Transcript_60167/g.134234  ORF Transcript_60167/g.134234 Transcript_60167/m.134234 type:complete len:522 (+) Transcript_60167:2-1567(+)
MDILPESAQARAATSPASSQPAVELSSSKAVETPGAKEASSKRRRLEQMGHLEVDKEIIRGVSLRATLRQGGKLWRTSPIDMPAEDRAALWDKSSPAEAFDVFLSHTWLTPGRWKVLSLLFQSGWEFILLTTGLATAVVFMFGACGLLPMPFTLKVEGVQDYSAELPNAPWMSGAALLGTIFGLFTSPYFLDGCQKTTCFLDVVSIHQSDHDLMERGIYGLGGFLRVSRELRVLWSPPYLSRLWCVFELAAYRKANPQGHIKLKPLYIEAGVLALICGGHFAGLLIWTSFALNLQNSVRVLAIASPLLPVYVLIHLMRVNTRAKHILLEELRGFDLSRALCRSDFDKEFVHAAIVEWYGSQDAFTEYVRGELCDEMLGVESESVTMPLPYLIISATASVTSSFNSALSMLVGGAPGNVIASEVIAVAFGYYFFYFLPLLKISIAMSEHFAKPRWISWWLDYVQTAAILLVFFVFFYAGDVVSLLAKQTSLLASVVWCGFTVSLSWIICFGGWRRCCGQPLL